MKRVDEKAFGNRFTCHLCYNMPDHFGRRIHVSQETPRLEQRGVEVVPKDERTVGFWDLFVIWGWFLHHHDQLLAGALGDGVGIGPAIFAHMIGILILAGVVWFPTILGSEQGIAGPLP
jgi:cytosine/uracil/thiamine/allantoin permease